MKSYPCSVNLKKKKKREEQPPKITLNLYTLIKGSITITFFLTSRFLFSNIMVILICCLSYELCIIKRQVNYCLCMICTFYFSFIFNYILVKTFGNYGSRELFNITFSFSFSTNSIMVMLFCSPHLLHVMCIIWITRILSFLSGCPLMYLWYLVPFHHKNMLSSFSFSFFFFPIISINIIHG